METNENKTTLNEVSTIDKARAILKARLPRLTSARLNFEKRTGAFFKASETENGVIARNVVSELPNDAATVAEIEAKRAAARVVRFENERAALLAKIDAARAVVETLESEHHELVNTYNSSRAVVDNFDLPERETLSTRVERQLTEIERLRALLAAAGIEA